MRRRLVPLLFAKEGRPPEARRKDRTREALEGRLPLQSFPDLLASLTTLTTVEQVDDQVPGYAIPAPGATTELQRTAFDRPGLKPHPAPSLAAPPDADAKPGRAAS